MSEVYRILIVEDQENDYELAKREINQVLESCEFVRVETPEDFINSLLNFKPDLIVSDFTMPHFDGLSVIKLALQNAPLTPVIICTGTLNEETAAEVVKAGAVDYVLKENIKRLKQAILQALEKKQMWQERIAAEEKLRESEERYRLISNVSSDYMFSTKVNPDGSQKVNWLAGAFEAITGYTTEEYIKLGGWSFILYHDDIEQDKKDFENLKANRQVVTELRNVKKNGEIYWVKVYAHPVWDNIQNRLISIYGAVQDITERKKAEEATYNLNIELESLVKERTKELENTNADLQKEILIRAAADELIKHQLLEKEILLKEIHHRVKNNMQIIISMLHLQSSFLKDEKIVAILQDSQSRIKTMALIHERLYQTKDLASIDLTEYLNNLCAYLFTSYIFSDRNVKYFIDAGKHAFDLDTTIALGLITNELVTNSFKYAFTDESEGAITILLKKFDEENLEFSISDNGKGLPENFDYRNSNTLGLQLVCMLTEQIGGKLDVNSSNRGTAFSIVFPHENNSGSDK
jgi:PAS domain S-box-containing protein